MTKTLRQLAEEAAYNRGFVDGRASVPTDPELMAGINIGRNEIERLRAKVKELEAASVPTADTSPTSGMTLGERISHVGGRPNEAGCIEFGSVMAVNALIHQVLRDIPQPQAASVPEGWQLVPVKPTQDMVDSAKSIDGRLSVWKWADGYAAMLAAAPQAQAAPRPTDDELWDETLRDRDRYHEAADELTDAIATHFGQDFGEHSSANFPWENALEYMSQSAPQAPDTAALVEALEEATQSLETIATKSGKIEYMINLLEVRSYANSRAKVARAALAEHKAGEV